MTSTDDAAVFRIVSEQLSPELPVLERQLGDMVQACCDATNFNAAAAMQAALGRIREIKGEAQAATSPEPVPPPEQFPSMYRTPNHLFSREQLVFVVEMLLATAIDRIESCYPPIVPCSDQDEARQSQYVTAHTDFVLLAVPILWAQLHGEGMGDAEFSGAEKWRDDVRHFRSVCLLFQGEPLDKAVKAISLARPDSRKLAEMIVDANFGEYLDRAASEPVEDWLSVISNGCDDLQDNLNYLREKLQSATSGRTSRKPPNV